MLEDASDENFTRLELSEIVADAAPDPNRIRAKVETQIPNQFCHPGARTLRFVQVDDDSKVDHVRRRFVFRFFMRCVSGRLHCLPGGDRIHPDGTQRHHR